MVLISDAFFIFTFSLRISYKMVEFVLKFIDRMIKQKIWFEYGLQMWFVCGFGSGW